MESRRPGKGVGVLESDQTIQLRAHIRHSTGDDQSAGVAMRLLGVDQPHHAHRPRRCRDTRARRRRLAVGATRPNTDIPQARRPEMARALRGHPAAGKGLKGREQVDDAEKSDSHVNSRKSEIEHRQDCFSSASTG